MPLSRGAPSLLGVDAAGVSRFVDAVGRFELHGLIVVKSGRVVAEAEWAPYRLREPALMYSLSKGFTAAAVGLTVGDGLVGLDDRVLDHLPEYADRTVAPLRDLRIRHLLTMSSGHARDLLTVAHDRSDDLIEVLLTTVPEHAPGTWFQYNQPATFTAAAIVARRTGMRLLDYLRGRLFDRFAAAEPLTWAADSRGRDLGFSGLRTDIETIACLGQLLLDDGTWDGERLLPKGWVIEASTAHIQTPREPSPDWRCGYGYQLWLARHGYRHDGAYGQFCLVFPEKESVVAITSATEDMQSVLDEVYRHLLPALDAGTTDPAADRALLEQVARLSIELPELQPHDLPAQYLVQSPARWAPSRVHFDGQKARLLFAEGSTVGDLEHRIDCQAGRWSDGDLPTSAGPLKIRSRGGRRADGTPYLTLVVINAPHRLELHGTTTGTMLVDWNLAPLHGIDPATLVAR